MRDDVTLPDGTTLPTWTTGTLADLPPVLLLGGESGGIDALADLAALLDTETLVHRCDLRDEAGGAESLVPAVAAEHLDALRTAWGHERWVLIGHAQGADLALAAAAAHPGAVAALAYVDGPGLPAEDDPLGDVAATVDAPLWFVHGTEDPRPVGPVMALAARARRTRKRILEGAGTSPWVEQPERTREVLLEVLHSGR